MSSSIEVMTAYLRSLISHQGSECVESVLLDKGTWFEGRRHSDDYPTAKVWKPKAEPQQCYANSQHYCVRDKQTRYFEGYALIPGTPHPIEHAWIVMSDGGVLDFTLELIEVEAEKQGIPTDTSQTVYLGLEIPTRFATIRMLMAGETHPLLEMYCYQDQK